MNDTPKTPPTAPVTGGQPAAPRVSVRLLRSLLAVSVALNLAVVGAVAGAMFHKGGGGARDAATRDLGFGPFSEALSPDDRRALREALQKRAPELRSANQQRRADVAALQAALRADPFVPANLTAALEAMRGRLESQLSLGHLALGEVILTMSDAERRALADRLERGLRRGGGDRGGLDRGDKNGKAAD